MHARRNRVSPIDFVRESVQNTWTTPFFMVKIKRSPTKERRYAIVVGRRVDSRATTRNAIKRRLSEAVRGLSQEPLDTLILARPEAKNATITDLRKLFASLSYTKNKTKQ